MTIDKVREHFKGTKVIKDTWNDTFDVPCLEIQVDGAGRFYTTVKGKSFIIHDKSGFAEIIEYKDMKEIKIQVPEGHEIDEANSTFSCIKFKKIEKQLPNTWEEYCDYAGIFHHVFKNAWCRYPKDITAMQKLRLLRDCYNDGWKADWSETSPKPVIQFQEGELRTDSWRTVQTFLNFKTADLRDKFLENFKDIIEIAKPLL